MKCILLATYFFFMQEVDFIVEIGKVILKFLWDRKWPGLAKTILKKKNRVGGLTSHFPISNLLQNNDNHDRVVLEQG